MQTLFERFIRLNEQRIAELSVMAIVPELDGAESTMVEIDPAPSESVEERYSALEESLGLEFHGVE